IRTVQTDGAGCRWKLRAVCTPGHAIDEHLGSGQTPARAQVVGGVVEVHRMRTVEFVRAARKVLAEIEVEIEDHAAGHIRGAIGAVQPSREVDAGHVYRPGAVPAGDLRIERQLSLD